jgi:hypothetical protein
MDDVWIVRQIARLFELPPGLVIQLLTNGLEPPGDVRASQFIVLRGAVGWWDIHRGCLFLILDHIRNGFNFGAFDAS